jgi:hypothetical protein
MHSSTQVAGIPRLSTLDLFPALDPAARVVSLEELLADAPLPPAEALHLGAALAQQVAAIHASGRVVGLLDASRVRISAAGQVSLTRTGTGGLAPELRDGGTQTQASDIYAVGFLIHHLVTGQAPAPDIAPSQLNPRLDAEFDSVLLATLRAVPENRPAAVLALEAALEGLGEELGICADAAALGQRVERLLGSVPLLRQTLPPMPAADAWFANPGPTMTGEFGPVARAPNPRLLLASAVLAMGALLFTAFAVSRPVAASAPPAAPAAPVVARVAQPAAPVAPARVVAQAPSLEPVAQPTPAREEKRPAKRAKVRRTTR